MTRLHPLLLQAHLCLTDIRRILSLHVTLSLEKFPHQHTFLYQRMTLLPTLKLSRLRA